MSKAKHINNAWHNSFLVPLKLGITHNVIIML
jgi:hypothetical protein